MVTSVAVTSGRSRMSRATRSPTSSVLGTDRPSGRRTTTSNCARSSTGKKPLRAIFTSGTRATSEPTETSTTIHRRAMRKSSSVT